MSCSGNTGEGVCPGNGQPCSNCVDAQVMITRDWAVGEGMTTETGNNICIRFTNNSDVKFTFWSVDDIGAQNQAGGAEPGETWNAEQAHCHQTWYCYAENEAADFIGIKVENDLDEGKFVIINIEPTFDPIVQVACTKISNEEAEAQNEQEMRDAGLEIEAEGEECEVSYQSDEPQVQEVV